jgi:DNA-binding response OmpR family regulator
VKILVVHGDPEVGAAYRSELEQSGDSVWLAEDREQALTWAEQKHPDAIIVSLRPPGADALALLEELRADGRTSEVPLVIVSDLDERELTERGVRLRATDFVVTRPQPPRRH